MTSVTERPNESEPMVSITYRDGTTDRVPMATATAERERARQAATAVLDTSMQDWVDWGKAIKAAEETAHAEMVARARIIAPSTPSWATSSDDETFNGEVIVYSHFLDVPIVETFNDKPNGVTSIQLGLGRTDYLEQDGWRSGDPHVMITSHSDVPCSVAEARKIAAEILNLCDKADIDSGDLLDLSEFPFTDLLGSLIRRATKAGELDEEVSGRLQSVLRKAAGR